MLKTQSIPTLETERRNTDDSLGAERDKTTDALMRSRDKTERTTDEVVRAERDLADERTTSSRVLNDLNRELKRGSLGATELSKRDTKQLNEERDSADRVTEQERTQVDAAIVRERKDKKTMFDHFLENERGQTDDNLSAERDESDSRMEKGATLLSSEIAEHLKTRTSLTTRDEFLAIVSHDLRNPIGTAFTCAEMLLEGKEYQNLDPKVRTWIEMIKRNTEKSLRLISDLLDMERVAEGNLQLRKSQVDIGELIRQTIHDHDMAAAAKKIQLQSSPESVQVESLCDRDRVVQVLGNLVGNAIKFTPDGGSITLGVELIETKVRVYVQDTGPGFPEDRQKNIFNRFVQIETADRSGLGLGLHISKMLVEAHGGQIWANSVVGEGSKFFFTLPNSKASSAAGMH